MNTLTFSDIFIGDNGIVVLISSMLLALGGSLFKKYQRYNAIQHETKFDIKFWAEDNWDDMIVGFFVTYVMVRLLNLITPYALSAFDLEAATMAVSDILVVVSIFIGYYSDSFLEKLIPTKRN